MLATAKVMAFVATAQPEAARQFYAGVLGLTLLSEDDFAIVFETSGRLLRLQKVPALTPQSWTALGWRVVDIESEVDSLVARGVSFECYDFLPQDSRGIWMTPDGSRVAWFKDPDGNTLSLTQFV